MAPTPPESTQSLPLLCHAHAPPIPLIETATLSIEILNDPQVKPCPGCTNPVQLPERNQTVCVKCDHAFCWSCGTPVPKDGISIHNQWWSWNSCQEAPYPPDTFAATIFYQKVYNAYYAGVAGPVYLLLAAVLTVPIFLCCAPGCGMSWSTVKEFFLALVCVVELVVLGPVTLLYVVVFHPIIFIVEFFRALCCSSK